MKNGFTTLLLLSAFTLGGCQSLGNGYSYVNGHFPTIGAPPCESWQCFTQSGQQQSELNRQARLAREAAAAKNPEPPTTEPVANAHPINAATPAP